MGLNIQVCGKKNTKTRTTPVLVSPPKTGIAFLKRSFVSTAQAFFKQKKFDWRMLVLKVPIFSLTENDIKLTPRATKSCDTFIFAL